VLPGTSVVERLRSVEAPAGTVFAHPAGVLELRQSVVPLGLKLSKFGNAPVKTHDTFRIDRDGDDGEEELLPILDHFARGQFEDLSSDQRLSLPSFEKLQSGVAILHPAMVNGQVVPLDLSFESIVVGGDGISWKPTIVEDGREVQRLGTIPWTLGGRLVDSVASGKRARGGGLGRFKSPGTKGKIRIEQEGYFVVDASSLLPIDEEDIPGNDGSMSRVEADHAMDAYAVREGAAADTMLVVASFEATQ
jgi:hypothetical protein